MNLDNLKPAWKQFLFLNSMQAADQKEILSIIEKPDAVLMRRLPGYMTITFMFMILTVCCQGG